MFFYIFIFYIILLYNIIFLYYIILYYYYSQSYDCILDDFFKKKVLKVYKSYTEGRRIVEKYIIHVCHREIYSVNF